MSNQTNRPINSSVSDKGTYHLCVPEEQGLVSTTAQHQQLTIQLDKLDGSDGR